MAVFHRGSYQIAVFKIIQRVLNCVSLLPFLYSYHVLHAKANNFTMAYHFKGDLKWDDLLSIYGPREPVANDIVLSSDESEDNTAGHGNNVQDFPPQSQSCAPSMLSRNMQHIMWENIGYASDSEEERRDANGSTANSRKEMRKIHDAQKETQDASTSTRNRTTRISNGSSLNNSSCASNDPFGKRNA